MKFNVESPIWLSKQRILCALNQSLKDVLNYGLFQPAYNGKAGKFLDEQRTLKEYPLPGVTPIPYLEVRAKKAPDAMPQIHLLLSVGVCRSVLYLTLAHQTTYFSKSCTLIKT